MLLKKLCYLFLLCAPILCVSCGDDDDSTDIDKNLDDPRLRSVRFTNLSSTSFVINDVESIIYNYDSIPYGTDVSKLKVYIYGYTSSPTILYKHEEESEWSVFDNGTIIDFTTPITFHSTSQDGTNSKVYNFDLRIHKFDVASFSWEGKGSIDNESKIISQKAISINSKDYWFCRTEEGKNICFSSSKSKTWEKEEVASGKSMKWESLALFSDSLWVQDEEGTLYTSSTSKIEFNKKETSVSIDQLLFEVGGKLWAIGGEDIYAIESNESVFSKRNSLPKDFSKENLTVFTANSGFTQLGYLYSTKDNNGVIWSFDYKGNIVQLVQSGADLPYLEKPMVYVYGNTLGIVGGKEKSGEYSNKCYASYDSGVTWKEDWHKRLSNDVEGLNNAGVFVRSEMGELTLVGGNIKDTPSKQIWEGVLNQIIADDLNYRN